MMDRICCNPWCKALFEYSLPEGSKEEDSPVQCPKCKSFDSELSGGVTWNTKEYEGGRFDGMPHQIRYRITNYR